MHTPQVPYVLAALLPHCWVERWLSGWACTARMPWKGATGGYCATLRRHSNRVGPTSLWALLLTLLSILR